jgi:hypothetical protein
MRTLGFLPIIRMKAREEPGWNLIFECKAQIYFATLDMSHTKVGGDIG